MQPAAGQAEHNPYELEAAMSPTPCAVHEAHLQHPALCCLLQNCSAEAEAGQPGSENQVTGADKTQNDMAGKLFPDLLV